MLDSERAAVCVGSASASTSASSVAVAAAFAIVRVMAMLQHLTWQNNSNNKLSWQTARQS
eukprot:364943-Chlamydomonas_euryale.AAC.41